MSNANPGHFAPRYLSRFRCIGGDCEETCCQGWTITIDEKSYRRLKVLMDHSAADRQRFRESHQRNRKNPSVQDYARIQPRASDGKCPLLDNAGRCTTHARFGEALLSDTCATYPRVISRNGARVELTGSPSCPELARRLLLDDDALALDPLDPVVFARLRHGLTTQASAGAQARDPFDRHLDDVRAALLHVLRLDGPLDERLWVMARFAQRLHPFFHRGSTKFDETALAVEIARLEDPATLDAWCGELAALRTHAADRAAEIGVRLALGLLKERLESLPAGRLRSLCLAILDANIRDGVGARHGSGGDERIELDRRRLWERYCARRAALADVADRVDRRLAAYAGNHVLRTWYTRSPSLPVYVQRLLSSIALLRFIVYSNPRLDDVAALAPDERQALVDEVTVEAVWAFARSVEHSTAFIEHVERLLASDEASVLATSACILSL
jgi:lysine-N-methylase